MLRLFEGFGVELEYMLVDRETLSVRPIADQILRQVAGGFESDVERGAIAWSNELVLHVIELKTNGPARSLHGLADQFQAEVGAIHELAGGFGAKLLPAGAHPWMDPHTETRLWPHEYSSVYHTFNRIFDCRGHGWSNLQSTHLNLPFADDDEFGRLHTAIRLLLPILPGLAASTPILDGRDTGLADARLDQYRHNADRIPSVMGRVIPEAVRSREEYHNRILEPMYRDIAPHDPEGILQHEWLNARGAIARFDRNAIEIRVLDVQECPQADLAIVMLIVSVLRALCEETWCSYHLQQSWETEPLVEILNEAIGAGDRGVVLNEAYPRLFGWSAGACTIGELWRHLADTLATGFGPSESGALEVILSEGCLSRRIRGAAGEGFGRARLAAVYTELGDCLQNGRMFRPDVH